MAAPAELSDFGEEDTVRARLAGVLQTAQRIKASSSIRASDPGATASFRSQ